MDVNNKRFWELLEPEHARAQHFCRGLSGNREDGDDLYQESVLAALSKFPQLNSEESFRAWFYRIVINRYRNGRKTWWIRKVVGWKEPDSDSQSTDPAVIFTQKDLARRLLAILSPRDRSLITLFQMEGWSIRELGALFGSSEGAIKVKLSRIRKALRKQLLKFEAEVDSEVPVKFSKEKVCVAGKSDPS